MKNVKVKLVKKGRRLRRLRRILAGLGIGFVGLVGTLVIYNSARSCAVKNEDLTIDPFSPQNVFDEDLEFDDNGQIVFDTFSDEEKEVLDKQIKGFVLQDANNLLNNKKIERVDNILSINYFPSNSYSESPQKYYLSILFSDGDKNYTINYFTSEKFTSTEEITKNYFTDFIDYLSYDCALYRCEEMTELGQEIATKMGDDVCFVGNTYGGYTTSDAVYCIPVYYADGICSLYYATKSLIDMDDLNPMQQLSDELTQDVDNILFESSPCEKDEEIEKILEIYNNISKIEKGEDLLK